MYELLDTYRGYDLGVALLPDGRWSGLAKGIATVIRTDDHSSKADAMESLYRRIDLIAG